MAIIHYDEIVLSIADRIAASPTATKGDIKRLIRMNEHQPEIYNEKNRERMPYSNYLGKEAISKLRTLEMSLPNRIHK